MINKKIFFLLPIFLILPTAAFATPQVTVNTQYYDIQGNSANELRREMHRKGIKEGGRTFDAHTDWHVSWNYHYHPSGGYCVVEQVATTVKVNYILPRWTNRDAASQSLTAKWDKYYEALKLHEKGHEDIGRKAAAEIESVVSKLGAVGCPSFNAKANSEGDRILEKYRKIEIDYDKNTQHGELQGARFP